MRRAIFLVPLLMTGCRTMTELNRLEPPPAEGPPLVYREVIQRARNIATAATEAFYIDKWEDVQLAAGVLEQTADYLPRSADIPESRKASVTASSQNLAKESRTLREAARSKDEAKVNETLQRIHLRVRELRE